MTAANLLVANLSNTPNFHNLALFICHLFIDGHFRFGHILYDPNVFDHHFSNEIESICSVQIPWLTTDITQPSSLPWKSNDRTDQILQLIFFDPKNVPDQFHQSKNHLTFYRIFVFSSVDSKESNAENGISVVKKLSSKFDSNSLIVECNLGNGSLNIHWTSEKLGESLILDTNQEDQINDMNYEQIFDQTFGRNDQMQSIMIHTLCVVQWKKDHISIILDVMEVYISNYFFSTLNATYINMTCLNPTNQTNPSFNQSVVQIQRNYFKELSFEYEPIENCELAKFSESYWNSLHITSTKNDRSTSIHSLYPYRSIKLMVLFVYGTDFTRRMSIVFVPTSVQLMAISIVLFMSFAAITLRLMRQKFQFRRNSVSLVVLDILVAFISGGNLRVRHHVERWFFGILLLAAFFINSLFVGDILSCVYYTLDQRISTFDQLVTLNAPIFISNFVSGYNESIHEMFRLKVASSVDFKGPKPIRPLSSSYENCFIYVTEINRLDTFGKILRLHNRDFDLLDDHLDEINSQFVLESNHYVTERLLKKIDRLTSSMIENGLHQYFAATDAFKRNFHDIEYSNVKDEEFKELTIDQLKRPMILMVGLVILATVILIIQIIVFKLKGSHP